MLPNCRHGVPPSGGEALEGTTCVVTSGVLDVAKALPAEAGTPCGAWVGRGVGMESRL